MTAKRVTLKDLSDLTGFDKSTISRALRNDPTLSIRPDNLRRIQQAAEDMAYVPNMAGRSLRSARSYSIGAVVPSLQNQIHAQIMEGAQNVCRARGYSLLIAHVDQKEHQPELFQQLVRKHNVDGLLVLTFQNEQVQVPELKDLGVPVVMVNRKSDQFDNWVMVGERKGGALATKHLIDFGHRQIAHITGDLRRYNAQERHQGYKDALEEAGIPFDPNLVQEGGYTLEEGASAMEALLDRAQGAFTALFAVCTLPAAGALHVLRKRKVDVPGDVSVIGFHDGTLAEIITPTLTTVFYPLAQLGQDAANGMIDLLAGQDPEIKRVYSDGKIIQRESTSAISR